MKKLLAFVLLGVVTVASYAAYPERPLKLIVPGSAGTFTDVLARAFAQALSPHIKQPVVIENIVGAEGAIGAQAAARAAPDGYTALFVSSSTTILDPLLKQSLPFNPAKDFTPVCSIARIGNVVNMSSALPYKSIGEFIAAAKKEPGKYTFAYSSATTRLAGELFQQQAGVKLTNVPYRSSAPGLNDVAGGQVSLFFIDHVSALPFYQSGKLRPLLAAGAQRYKALPDVPSAVEAGVPGYEIWPSTAIFLPAKTPAPIVAQLRDAVAQALKAPSMAAMRERSGLEEFSICGDEMVKYEQREIERWEQVIKKAGIEKQ